MIKLHFHKIDSVLHCHLYSDTGCIKELKQWCQQQHISRYSKWIRKDKFPHIDLFGDGLFLLYSYPIVRNREFARDMKAWKEAQALEITMRQRTI